MICDDNSDELQILKSYIERFFFELPESYNYKIDTCSNGEELLAKCNSLVYHAIFLDIELPDFNGIDIAKNLRKENDNVFIIFVTSYEKYMRDSFEVQPFRFIDKPISYEFTYKICQSLIKALTKTHFSIITISTVDGEMLINANELLYIQSVKNKKNTLSFFLSNGDKHISTGKFSYWEEELKSFGFISSIRGTLVNINHVRIITNNQLILKNDEILPLSRRQAKLFHDTFVNHIISVLE